MGPERRRRWRPEEKLAVLAEAFAPGVIVADVTRQRDVATSLIYQQRPHSALGYLTPAAFAGTFAATGDRLRNPDQLRRSPVAPPALLRQSQPATLAPTG